jgi:hypothetical protein
MEVYVTIRFFIPIFYSWSIETFLHISRRSNVIQVHYFGATWEVISASLTHIYCWTFSITLADKMPHIEDCDDDENERGAEEVEQDATPATCTQYEQHICDDMYCTTHHGSLPYLWRLRRGKIWKIIEDSRGIEEAFCNPNCSSYDVVLEVRAFEYSHGPNN